MSSTEKPLNALLSLNTCCLLYLLFRWWRLLRIGHSFILAARRLRSERSGDSDCCLSSIIRSVAWRRLSKQKGTGNSMGAILQAFYWDCPKAENREHQWWTSIKSKLPSITRAG